MTLSARNLLPDMPWEALLLGWNGLEHTMRAVLYEQLEGRKDMSTSGIVRTFLEWADKSQTVEPAIVSAIRKLRLVRNQAAHSDPKTITAAQAEEFIVLAAGVADELKRFI